MFAAADAADLDTFMTFMTDDVRYQFGDGHPVLGKQAVAEAIADFFASITSQTHYIDHEFGSGHSRVVMLTVTYERLDGSTVTLPAIDILRVVDGLIAEYRILMDASP